MVSELTKITSTANLVFMAGDPAYEMYRQATLGDVDFITGDYLAGMRILTPNTLPDRKRTGVDMCARRGQLSQQCLELEKWEASWIRRDSLGRTPTDN